MARIAGVNIPSAKRLFISLTYIYGIGVKTARDICRIAGVDENRRVHTLEDSEVIKLREAIDSGFLVEGQLRKEVDLNKKLLREIKCYRGRRDIARLPSRGQRTHTNARTRKGKAVAIAGKKKVTK